MSSIPLGSPGSLYLMRCESHSQGILKVGVTTLDPHTRAKQLTAATASPIPFHVLYSREVPDVNAAEAAAHSALAGYRVNDKREYFRVSVYEAARTIDALFGPIETGLPMTFEDLFATFAPNESNELTPDEQAQCRALEQRLGLYQSRGSAGRRVTSR